MHNSASDLPCEDSLAAIKSLHVGDKRKAATWNGKKKLPNGREIKHFGWDDVGYHKVFVKSGKVERGRPDSVPGAHAYGYNGHSLGYCVTGLDVYSDEQIDAVIQDLKEDLKKYGLTHLDVVGHYELNKNKTCPNMDMDKIRRKLL